MFSRRHRLFSTLAWLTIASAGLITAGCGGSLARNSVIEVRFERFSGADPDMTNVQWVISPNNGDATNIDAATSADSPQKGWITETSLTGAVRVVKFSTSSFQVPFVLYGRSLTGSNLTCRVRILVDGTEQYNLAQLVQPSATFVRRILRNNVEL